MSHIAFEIENWVLPNTGHPSFDIKFNEKVLRMGLDIDAVKFYYFLRKKFGVPNINFESVKHFFPPRQILYKAWCYLIRSANNYIVIYGDDKVNISVLSLTEPPNEVDFLLFANKCNQNLLPSINLKEFEDGKYHLFANYHYALHNLIAQHKSIVNPCNLKAPEFLSANLDGEKNIDPERQYKFIEARKDFNLWIDAVMGSASSTIILQNLLPIYFECLVEFAFRIKLKKGLFNNNEIYEIVQHGSPKKVDVFKYFQSCPVSHGNNNVKTKIDLIGEMCFQINPPKLNDIKIKLKDFQKMRNSRNQLLHGNPTLFKNTEYNFYYDEQYIVGLPDRANFMKLVVETIQKTIAIDSIDVTIKKYDDLCESLINIFEDENYFREVVSGIIFGHNFHNGGSLSFPITQISDLYDQETF